jgi:hypothetical protein
MFWYSKGIGYGRFDTTFLISQELCPLEQKSLIEESRIVRILLGKRTLKALIAVIPCLGLLFVSQGHQGRKKQQTAVT